MVKFLYTILGIVFVGLLGWFLFDYFYTNASGPTVTFNLPTEIKAGQPFDFDMTLENQSGNLLEDVTLSLNLPKELVILGDNGGSYLVNKTIGSLGVGSVIKEKYSAMALKSGVSVGVRTVVRYRQSGLNTYFEKEEVWSQEALESLKMTFTLPDNLVAGNNGTIKLLIENVSGADFPALNLKMEYPKLFKFDKSSVDGANADGTLMPLGGLAKGAKNNISILGKFLSSDQAVDLLRAKIVSSYKGDDYVIAEQDEEVGVDSAPVSLSVKVNGADDYVAHPGETLHYEITYKYLDNDKVKENLKLRAVLAGEMFDWGSVVPSNNGVFNLGNKNLTWNGGGMTGEVRFDVMVLKDYPIRKLSDRRFKLSFDLTLDDGALTVEKLLETKVAGGATVKAKAYFRDAESGVLNTGIFPPKVGSATDFSVHWGFTTLANDLHNVVLRAKLPAGVVFKSVGKIVGGNDLYYNKDDNEVVWEIGKVSANKGVISSEPLAVFQVTLTPTSSQVGSFADILGDTKFSGTDDFTDLLVEASDDKLTTQLPDDLTVANKGLVK